MRIIVLLSTLIALSGCDTTDPKGEGGDASGDTGGSSGDDGGSSTADADQDGIPAEDDCDDTDPAVGLGATFYADEDGDGYGAGDAIVACTQPEGAEPVDGDCDDLNAAFHPGAAEDDCEDPADYNCDGSVGYVDADGDGAAACVDCDDAAAEVFPGAVELCNGQDDDCDGEIDEAGATGTTTYYVDGDGDGYGTYDAPIEACAPPEGSVTVGGDCNDGDASVSPAALERCDADDTDEDCDGLVDDFDDSVDVGTFTLWYADADNDLYGDTFTVTTACDQPTGYVANDEDCDDTATAVNPGAVEVCDPLDTDENCDGLIDDDDPGAAGLGTYYADSDGDGFGDPATALTACDAPTGLSSNPDDCDDGDASSSPLGAEVCDGRDNDCDGTADDGLFCRVTFTTCGAAGAYGPSQTACDAAYGGTELDGQVTVTAGVQRWTVPAEADYQIEAWGAKGAAGDAAYLGGAGAYAAGVLHLQAGDVISVVVGQAGLGQSSASNGGGGGGSFVVLDSGSQPLVIAGGGGGTREAVLQDGCDGRADRYGGVGSRSSETVTCAPSGDALGGGGSASSESWGSGGGGLLSAGADDYTYGHGGQAFFSGAEGGRVGTGGGFAADGGFGCGGSGNGYYGGGGGGGYTGGQGGRVAGGGGSYVDDSATDVILTEGANFADGEVNIQPI